jgi:hypothetical protein
MNPSEIIIKNVEQHGLDPKPLMVHLHQLMQLHQVIILHTNNSVLTITKILGHEGSVSLHLYSLDSPIVLMKSLTHFFQQIKQIPHISVLYGDTTNQNLLALLGKIGLQVEQSDLPSYTWMARI